MSFQQVIVEGNLGADPEVTKLQSGSEVCNFNLAVSEKYKSGGETVEHTEWFRCSTWNEQLIDVVDRFCRKGDKLMVVGKLRTRKYTDRDGVERTSTDVNVFSVNLIEHSPNSARGGGGDRGGDRGRDDRGGGREATRGADRGGDRGRDAPRGRDDRGGGRDDRSRDDRGGGRDDRGRDDRGGGREATRGADRGGDRGGGRDDRGGSTGGYGGRGGNQGGALPDDEVPFSKQYL